MLMATQSPTTVVTVTAVILAIDFLIVGLRVLARRQRRQSLLADDWLCFISLILCCALATTLFIGVAQKALGYPTPMPSSIVPRIALDTMSDKITIVARLQYIFLVISVPTLGAIKTSVLFFYRRIFVVDKSSLRSAQNAMYFDMIALVGIWTVGFTFAFTFVCKGHFSAWWTSAISLMTRCVNTLELFLAFAVSDFICDVIILIMPITMILKLHLPLARKIGVLFVFLLGTIATIASLIRMIWVIWARQVGFDVSLDQNLLITTSLFWNMLEVSLGIIATCLPTLRGLTQKRSVDSLVKSIRDKISIRSGQMSNKSDDTVHLRDLSNGDESRGGVGTELITAADGSLDRRYGSSA